MMTSLDCIPCIIRQAVQAARFVTSDAAVHERIVRDVLATAATMDLKQSPPVVGQKVHRMLREMTGMDDPYHAIKAHFNRVALEMLPALSVNVKAASDPLAMAVRYAIAGNVIDLGITNDLTDNEVRRALDQVLSEPFVGDWKEFRRAIADAKSILYLADNAGEIVFDRLLIEQLPPGRVTLAVRGGAVLNDATMADAWTARLQEIAEVIDNGSDAPGTLLGDCSGPFLKRFTEADLIIAKGQGNFETLSEEAANIFSLFQVKCPVVATHTGLPIGTHVLVRSGSASATGQCHRQARV